jgi:hypothetical protein
MKIKIFKKTVQRNAMFDIPHSQIMNRKSNGTGTTACRYCLLLLLLCPVVGLAQTPDLLVCKDKGFTLTSEAAATGASAVTYTWYENGVEVPSSNTASLSIAAGKEAGVYSYARVASNDECTTGVSSNTYTVQVLNNAAPTISVEATPVCQGADVVFTVAPAANTTYSWSVVEGETGATAGDDRSTYTLSIPNYGTKKVQVTATVDYDINGLTKTCVSELSSVAEAVVNALPVVEPTGGPFAQCGGGTTTLGVTVTVAAVVVDGVSIIWYSDAGGSTQVGTGASYTTPSLIASTPYYVGATVNATGCASNGLTTVNATVNLYEGAISGQED